MHATHNSPQTKTLCVNTVMDGFDYNHFLLFLIPSSNYYSPSVNMLAYENYD